MGFDELIEEMRKNMKEMPAEFRYPTMLYLIKALVEDLPEAQAAYQEAQIKLAEMFTNDIVNFMKQFDDEDEKTKN